MLFYLSLIIFLGSIISFYYGKDKIALGMLFAAALCIRYYCLHLDPFLHDWDEKFHALVARNMIDDPLNPVMIRRPTLNYDYKAWCCNHIWLHKQPLFLWQMALSMKIFGVSEFTIRYPSMLMGALMVLLIYRIALNAAANRYIAFTAASIMCFANYHLELVAGVHGMDHNDIAFGFYVLASIWCYTEYLKEKSLKWALLIGVFAGCAILNKWLTGLLVYSAWGLNILTGWKRSPDTYKEIKHLLISIGACAIIFMPWQLYIHAKYPVEAAYEMAFNAKHVTEVVEGHGGSVTFYLENFPIYFGNWVIGAMVILGLLLSCLFKKYYSSKSILSINIYILIVFLFFSVIVASKLPTYFYTVAPLCFILIAIVSYEVVVRCKLSVKVVLLLLPVLCYYSLRPAEIWLTHYERDEQRQRKIYNTNIYKETAAMLPKNVTAVANINSLEDVEFMFFNNNLDGYQYVPNEETLKMLIGNGIPVAVYEERPGYPFPEYLRLYKDHLFIINKTLQR